MRLNHKRVNGFLLVVIFALCAWPALIFSMGHYLPEVDNDEVSYFLQVKTFLNHGLAGGYFFINDRVPASAIHFDVHGPGIPVIYGLLAHVIGWQNSSPYIANLLFFVPAWVLLLFATRDRPDSQIAVSVFVLLHGYFFLFLPSMMEESFHISIAVLMTALWTLALDRRSSGAWIGLAVVTVIAMIVRLTWGLTIPVFLFSFVQQRLRPTLIANAAVAVIVAVAGGIATWSAVQLWAYWALPAGAGGVSSGSLLQTAVALSNLRAFFGFGSLRLFANYPMYFRVSLWFLLGSFLAVSFAPSARSATRVTAAYAFLLLVVPTCAQMLFYTVDGWRDFRVLSSFHALAGLSFLSRADLAWAKIPISVRRPLLALTVILVAVNIAWTAFGASQRYEKNWYHRMANVDRHGQRLFASLETHMPIGRDETAFCKTVYAQAEAFNDPRLVHLPGGLAVSALEETSGALPTLKGKYALISTRYRNTRSSLRTIGIDPDNHEAILGAELSGRIPQGRLSGWADDDPRNPKPDWKGLLGASPSWRLETEFDEYSLFRSTVNCLDR